MSREEWAIEQMVPGGDGMARLSDGRIAFATGAVPGDRIVVKHATRHKSWVRADDWELSSPGPERVEPACAVANECGGCDWMHLARSAQLAAKESIIRQALGRTGGFRSLPDSIPIHTAGGDFGYRGRIRLHVNDKGELGLYAKASHRLIVLPGCPVSAPEIEQTLAELRALGELHPGGLAHWSEIEIRVAPAGPRVTLHLRARETEREPSAASRALLAALTERYPVLEVGEDGDPRADQRWPLPGGVELRAPPGGFTQVNWEVNQLLVAAVVDGAKARGVERFLDLYCGAGNFTLPLMAAGLSGVGIERSGGSIRAARRAARDARLSDDSFVAADVEGEVERLARRKEHFDLLLLDPPRTGAREAMPHLVALGAPFVAICSCDPVTLARDLKSLAATGYALDAVAGYDMFPHTHHVETLAWMRR